MASIAKIPKEKSWLSETDKRVIKIATYSVSGLVIAGTGVWATRNYLRNRKLKKSQKEAFTEGTAESYANRIIMAFENDGWWGTNIPALREVLRSIPNKQVFGKVAIEYRNQTKNQEIFADLKSELTGSEYLEMMNILAGKPDKPGTKKVFDLTTATAISRRLKAAFDYTILGMAATDKGAVKSALEEIPNIYAFAMVKVMYKKLYGHEVEEDLNSELDVFDFSWKDIVYTKPKR